MKQVRIVSKPTGSQTRCPICEITIDGESPKRVRALLRAHLRESHSAEEAELALTQLLEYRATQ